MSTDDIKRLNYYERQYLRTQDFKDEQAYHVKMRRHHLLSHHTWGIVSGLKVIKDKQTKRWFLQKGMAVDKFGREIIVPEEQELDINTIQDQFKDLPLSALPARLNLWLAYELEASDDAAPGYKACYDDKPFNRIQETYRLIYQNSEPKHTSKFQPQSKASVFDDPREQVSPVYLGTIVWGTDPPPPKNPEPGIQEIEDTNPPYARKYVGNITSDIQVPGPLLNMRSAIKSSFVATIWGDLITRILAILKLIVLDGANIDAANKNEGSLRQGAIVLGTAKDGSDSGEGVASTRMEGKENRFGLDFYTASKSRFSITNAGKVGIGTRDPQAQLDIAESFRVNEGTIFSNIQAGTAKVDSSPGEGIVFKTITITFPKKFDRVPMVIVTARTQHGENYDDTFAVTTKNISQSEFSVNVFRVDKKEAWAQKLQLDWFAWEKV